VKTRRWNDPPEPDDGFRLLVCRYRPRGVSKSDETWDAWWPELGPSRELHAAYWGKHGQRLSWEEYAARYLEEMALARGRIAWLVERCRAGESMTLLCSSACTDPERCHRSLLARLIERAAAGHPARAR
jgi:uncharacterized protein YeaO (DUF488 family)